MEESKFSAEKLRHVRGQDELIRDEEKAREMADIENDIRKYADLFDEYRTNPEAYGKKYENSELEHGFQALFAELDKEGATSEYIRAVGKLLAGMEGAIYDSEAVSGDISDFGLEIEYYKQLGLAFLESLKHPGLRDLKGLQNLLRLGAQKVNDFTEVHIRMGRAFVLHQERHARELDAKGEHEMAAYIRQNLRELKRSGQ